MDNIKEINGINIENIGKINAVTKGYFKNKNGVSYERYPYDANHVHVYRMMEASGTTVKDYISATNGTATSGLAIDTGYGINKKCRSWTTGIYKIDTGIKLPIGSKSIRFKYECTSLPVTNADIIMDSANISDQNKGIFLTINPTGKIEFFHTFGSIGVTFDVLSEKTLSINIWYDIMCTWDGTTNANGVKIYIKALTGTDAGKWYDSSNVAQTSIVVNKQGTSPSTSSGNDTYNLLIGNTIQSGFNLENSKIQDVQISNIVRTDMKEYI